MEATATYQERAELARAEALREINEQVALRGPVQFLTQFPNLELIIEPRRDPYTGPDGRRMPGSNGKRIVFDNIEYSTEDPEEILFCRTHEDFNIAFHEFGNAPGELKPTVEEQMMSIASASVDRNVDVLQELLESEQATHNRAPVISAATSALRSIAGVTEEV